MKRKQLKKFSTNIQINATNIRREVHEERNYLVAPVVILTEGVHCGSYGCILHKASELEKNVQTWNGVPLPIGHPQDSNGNYISANAPNVVDQVVLGRLYHVEYKDDKPRISGELWIDIKKANDKSSETLQQLNAGQLEVSTGMFHDISDESGTWNGEDYEGTAYDYRPDHVALLPNGEGACNWSDGCGAPRVNQRMLETIDQKNVRERHEFLESFYEELLNIDLNKEKVKEDAIKRNELSHGDKARAFQKVLDDMDTNDTWYILEDIWDKDFIYAEMGQDGIKYFRLGYSIDRDDNITLADLNDKQEVRKVTEWKTVQSDIDRNSIGGYSMTKEERVNALITCNKNALTENDRKFLMDATDELLDMLERPITPEVSDNQDVTDPKPDTPVINPNNLNDYELPEPVKERLQKYEQMFQELENEKLERKKALVAHIGGSSRNKFKTDELMAMEIHQLEKLAEMVKVTVDYSMQGEPEKPDYDDLGITVMEDPGPLFASKGGN